MVDPHAILIVEDNGIIAENLAMGLEELGYRVAGQAYTGEQAIQAALDLRPDLILMDIMLSGTIDGIDAAREIHRQASIPVIFLTAYADPETIERAKACQPYGYLVKPYNEVNIRAAIEIALHRRSLEMQLRASEERTWRFAEELERRNAELLALNSVITRLTGSRDLCGSLTDALEALLHVTGMDAALVQLADAESADRSIQAVCGISTAIARSLISEPSICAVLEAAVQTREVIFDRPAARPQLSIAAVPLLLKETCLGVAALFAWQSSPLEEDSLRMLATAGRQIGSAVENFRLSEAAEQVAIYQELDRLRSELIANVSHELRTPLGIIKVFATTLLNDDVQVDDAARREILQDIDGQTDRLEVIVSNLLDLSHFENGGMQLHLERVDLAELARNTLRAMETQRNANQVLVEELPAGALEAVADAARIEQVLRNLISNAIKYSLSGGEIRVRAGVDGDMIRFDVSDQGIGIPSEDTERIFDRFYRAENGMVRQVGGAGLGLAVCRSIIAAHGGGIRAENLPGGGSRFSFSVPIEAPERV